MFGVVEVNKVLRCRHGPSGIRTSCEGSTITLLLPGARSRGRVALSWMPKRSDW